MLATHCAVLTAEWHMKPRALKPNVVTFPYNFVAAEKIAAFCKANGQKLHGHTLFWHQEPIRWAESNDFDEVKRLYGGFIREVVQHFPDVVSWDVFNEIIEEKTRFRNEFLIRKFGYDFIDFCFRTVNESAPNAKLVINDFNLECAGDWCGSKQAHMLQVLRELRKRKTPVHVVGIQGHLSSTWKPSGRRTSSFIQKVADLGLDVSVSELDVNDSQFPEDVVKRDRMVAQYYADFLGAVLPNKSVKRVVFWGLSDSDHWIVRGQTAEKRKKGRSRPALFDDKDDPKPAFHAVAKALSVAPVRS